MITLNKLTKRFRQGDQETVAVDQISLSVSQGEVYGLLGPNGAGKTTTLRMVLGLLRPDSGEAEVGGIRVSDDPEEVKRRIGLVSASAGVYPWLTPRETLEFFASVYGVPIEHREVQVGALAEMLDMGRFLDQRCGTLSTGQKQRVTLARALVHNPPVVLLDEPTRGLDVVGSSVVFDYVKHLRGEGKAVIVCTHRLDEAQRICDRFGLLHRGKLRYEGRLGDLQSATGKESLVEMFLQLLEEPVAASATIDA